MISPIEVWIALAILGIAIGIAASVRSTCLDMEVGTNKVVCRRKIRWVEWGDVAPKSCHAIIGAGLAIVGFWGVRELLVQRGLPAPPPEASLEYSLVWGAVLAISSAVVVLATWLALRPLKD